MQKQYAANIAPLAPRLKVKKGKEASIWKYFFQHRYLYMLLIPALVYYIIFHYIPMAGAVIAFKDFNFAKGIFGSKWVGLDNFKYVFSLDKFWEVFGNTLTISLYRLTFGFPAPIIAALLLNEIKNMAFKRTVQTVIYLPHFISWVILGGILTNLLSTDYGIVNMVIKGLGGEAIGFLSDPKYFRGTLVFSMIWKEYGWNTIIYLAALSSIDPSYYEAAVIDGANRWRQTLYITLPCIKSTIVVLLVLRVGALMEAGFEQIFVLYHPGVFSVSDIIDTYVYRTGLADGMYSLAATVGLFKSAINFVLLIAANKFARMMGESGVY